MKDNIKAAQAVYNSLVLIYKRYANLSLSLMNFIWITEFIQISNDLFEEYFQRFLSE